ncbi:MAG: hypothetical protein KBC84_10110 [Proteobacteria bacterium]|nr:hypothetical protein [Pseudomonadota bacterium]
MINNLQQEIKNISSIEDGAKLLQKLCSSVSNNNKIEYRADNIDSFIEKITAELKQHLLSEFSAREIAISILICNFISNINSSMISAFKHGSFKISQTGENKIVSNHSEQECFISLLVDVLHDLALSQTEKYYLSSAVYKTAVNNLRLILDLMFYLQLNENLDQKTSGLLSSNVKQGMEISQYLSTCGFDFSRMQNSIIEAINY